MVYTDSKDPALKFDLLERRSQSLDMSPVEPEEDENNINIRINKEFQANIYYTFKSITNKKEKHT